MRRIPPVDEFFMEYLGVDCDFMESMREQLDKCSGFDFGTISDTMIEFAKRHTEAALSAAHQNMQLPEEDLEFTLNSYPSENIN